MVRIGRRATILGGAGGAASAGLMALASLAAPCERGALAGVPSPAAYDLLPPEAVDGGVDAGRDGGNSRGGARRDGGSSFDSSSAIPLRTISVSIDGVSFENGDVPRVPAALERIKKDFGRCAANEPLSMKTDASLEVRFIVRAPGRAEGVDVVQARGLSGDIVRCVTSQLAGRQVGSPSTDPVMVSVTVRFKKE